MLEQNHPGNDISQFTRFNDICKKLASHGITSETMDSFNTATWHYVLFKDALDSKDIDAAKEALQSFNATWPDVQKEIQRDKPLYTQVKPLLEELQHLTDEASSQFQKTHLSKNRP